MRQARKAVQYILEHLNDGDHFNVIAYNDQVEALFNVMQPVGLKDSILRRAAEDVDRIEASGGTNIAEAMTTALGMLSAEGKDRPRYVIFLTDGQPTVGETNENKILATVKKANGLNARCFVFGVGYDVNIRLLDKLAVENAGRSEYVKPKEPIEQKVSSLYNKIKDPRDDGPDARRAGRPPEGRLPAEARRPLQRRPDRRHRPVRRPATLSRCRPEPRGPRPANSS